MARGQRPPAIPIRGQGGHAGVRGKGCDRGDLPGVHVATRAAFLRVAEDAVGVRRHRRLAVRGDKVILLVAERVRKDGDLIRRERRRVRQRHVAEGALRVRGQMRIAVVAIEADRGPRGPDLHELFGVGEGVALAALQLLDLGVLRVTEGEVGAAGPGRAPVYLVLFVALQAVCFRHGQPGRPVTLRNTRMAAEAAVEHVDVDVVRERLRLRQAEERSAGDQQHRNRERGSRGEPPHMPSPPARPNRHCSPT